MYYFYGMMNHRYDERPTFVGRGPVASAAGHGNGADEEGICAWSPHPFICVVTGKDYYGDATVVAFRAELLPHTVAREDLPSRPDIAAALSPPQSGLSTPIKY